MIKLIHAADFHLDSPFTALYGLKAKERRQEQRELLCRLIKLVTDKNADLLLLSGDLLDSNRTFPETTELFSHIFNLCPCPIFIAPGNHDYYSHTSPYARLSLPDNVHIFKSPQINSVYLPQLQLTVWGAGFISNSAPNLLNGFKVTDPDSLNIMVLHGDLSSAASLYNPFSENDIAQSGLNYLALGHIHTFSGLKKAGDTYYAYPGCPEGRGFDETGEKGVIYAEITDTGCNAEFIPLCLRRYVLLNVKLNGHSDLTSAINASLPPDTENDIYRITLSGFWDEKPELHALTSELEQRFYKLEIRDNTEPFPDIWADSAEESLKGLFLRKLKIRFDNASSDKERDMLILAVRYGLAALDGRDLI